MNNKTKMRIAIWEVNNANRYLTVCTHANVDTDAIISLWLIKRALKRHTSDIQFAVANPEKGVEYGDIYVDYTPKQPLNKCVIIDHHIENTEYKSCASLIWDILELEKSNPHLKILVEYADAMDTASWTKLPTPFKHFTFGTLIASLRSRGYDDNTIINYICEFIDILEPYMRSLHQAEEIAKNIKIVNAGKFRVAILDEDLPPAVTGILFDTYNIDFAVYHVNNNIGIIRNANLTSPSLTKLKEHIDEDGWFFHHAGFIACRGSRKHPATTHSKYTIDDLLSFIQTL